MAKKKIIRPTDAELEILRVLWSQGPSTVREVHKILGADKQTMYNTTLKLLQIKLHEINRVVPAAALADLHKIPIWISVKDPHGRHPCACYHPSRGWLESNGYKVGLYTSPHVTNLHERITVNSEMISEAEMLGLLNRIYAPVERIAKSEPSITTKKLII